MTERSERLARDQRCERIVDELRDHLGNRSARVLERLHVLARWASQDVIDVARRGTERDARSGSAAVMRLGDLLAIIEERTKYYYDNPRHLD